MHKNSVSRHTLSSCLVIRLCSRLLYSVISAVRTVCFTRPRDSHSNHDEAMLSSVASEISPAGVHAPGVPGREANVGQPAAELPHHAASRNWSGCSHAGNAPHEPTVLVMHSQARTVDTACQSTVDCSGTLPHGARRITPTGRSALIASTCVFIHSLLNSLGARSSAPASARVVRGSGCERDDDRDTMVDSNDSP